MLLWQFHSSSSGSKSVQAQVWQNAHASSSGLRFISKSQCVGCQRGAGGSAIVSQRTTLTSLAQRVAAPSLQHSRAW
jgi:hypothetical protein